MWQPRWLGWHVDNLLFCTRGINLSIYAATWIGCFLHLAAKDPLTFGDLLGPGKSHSLPSLLISEVNALRQDFVTQNPAPAKLSRAEKAARNVSAAGKKAREITQALEDAIKAEDEAVAWQKGAIKGSWTLDHAIYQWLRIA